MGDTNERDSAPDAVRELRQGNVNKSVANLKRLFEKAQDNARASEPDEPPSTSNNKHRSETVAPGARKGAAGSRFVLKAKKSAKKKKRRLDAIVCFFFNCCSRLRYPPHPLHCTS
jgi:hypothetical protein